MSASIHRRRLKRQQPQEQAEQARPWINPKTGRLNKGWRYNENGKPVRAGQ